MVGVPERRRKQGLRSVCAEQAPPNDEGRRRSAGKDAVEERRGDGGHAWDGMAGRSMVLGACVRRPGGQWTAKERRRRWRGETMRRKWRDVAETHRCDGGGAWESREKGLYACMYRNIHALDHIENTHSTTCAGGLSTRDGGRAWRQYGERWRVECWAGLGTRRWVSVGGWARRGIRGWVCAWLENMNAWECVWVGGTGRGGRGRVWVQCAWRQQDERTERRAGLAHHPVDLQQPLLSIDARAVVGRAVDLRRVDHAHANKHTRGPAWCRPRTQRRRDGEALITRVLVPEEL